MQIVIDIPEGTKRAIDMGTINQVLTSKVWTAIKNGTPLPKHHGRLIDADVVADGFEDNYELCIAVNDTPTIIPATKEGENE